MAFQLGLRAVRTAWNSRAKAHRRGSGVSHYLRRRARRRRRRRLRRLRPRLRRRRRTGRRARASFFRERNYIHIHARAHARAHLPLHDDGHQRDRGEGDNERGRPVPANFVVVEGRVRISPPAARRWPTLYAAHTHVHSLTSRARVRATRLVFLHGKYFAPRGASPTSTPTRHSI